MRTYVMLACLVVALFAVGFRYISMVKRQVSDLSGQVSELTNKLDSYQTKNDTDHKEFIGKIANRPSQNSIPAAIINDYNYRELHKYDPR